MSSVTTYSSSRKLRDSTSFAPPLGPPRGSQIFLRNPYHDQDAWYTDCILANRLSSDFILVLDHDEYPMVNFNHPDKHSLSRQWDDFLHSLPATKGIYEISRVPMTRERMNGSPDPSRMFQDEYRCTHGYDRRVKSFYRSQSVLTVNQHKKRVSCKYLRTLLQTCKLKFSLYNPCRICIPSGAS